MEFTNDFFIQAQGCIERVARANRSKILELHGNVEVQLKDDQSVVTDLDKQLEQEFRETLSEFDSSIGFEGEEFGIDGSRETYWLIDPIDGTENFVRGMPHVRNIVTLINQNKPVFAVVYKPITDELYVAAEGEGTYRNGIPVKVSNRPIERAWIEWSSPFSNAETLPIAHAVASRTKGLRVSGEFLLAVEGEMDGIVGYKAGGGPWDYAPRALMMQEAGAKVANIGSDTYDFRNNDFVMANPVIFDDLMAIITENVEKNKLS